MNYSKLPFPVCHYVDVFETWPSVGNHIMGTHDSSTIVLFLNCRESTARFVAENKSFKLDFTHWKIDWILRPTFLAAIQTSDWGRKPEQSGLVALTVTRRGFEELMETAVGMEGSFFPEASVGWIAEKDPLGHPLDRCAIEVRIAKGILDRFLDEMLVSIEDITIFLKRQRKLMVESGALGQLLVPDETPYELLDSTLADPIKLDPWEMPPIPDQGLFRMDTKGTFKDHNLEENEVTPPLPPLKSKLKHPGRIRKIPLQASMGRGVFEENAKPRKPLTPVIQRPMVIPQSAESFGYRSQKPKCPDSFEKNFDQNFDQNFGKSPKNSLKTCKSRASKFLEYENDEDFGQNFGQISQNEGEILDNDVLGGCTGGMDTDCEILDSCEDIQDYKSQIQDQVLDKRSLKTGISSRRNQNQGYKKPSMLEEDCDCNDTTGENTGGNCDDFGGGSMRSMARSKITGQVGHIGGGTSVGRSRRSNCGSGFGGKSQFGGKNGGKSVRGGGFNSLEDICDEENDEEIYQENHGSGKMDEFSGRSRRGGDCESPPGSGKIWDKIRDAINDKYLRDEELDNVNYRNRPKFNIYD